MALFQIQFCFTFDLTFSSELLPICESESNLVTQTVISEQMKTSLKNISQEAEVCIKYKIVTKQQQLLQTVIREQLNATVPQSEKSLRFDNKTSPKT